MPFIDYIIPHKCYEVVTEVLGDDWEIILKRIRQVRFAPKICF